MSLGGDECPTLPGLPEVNVVRSAREAASYRSLALAWIAGATIVRFLTVADLPLGNGEAYYATWSRFLDWSYYDHPPLIAWLVRATTLLGSSPAAVRLVPILCAAAFGLLFHELARRLFGARAAFLSLVLVTALPVFLASSIVLNPEAPLAPLWVGYLLALERMREVKEPFRPLVAGALLGLAFLAKYTALLLVPSTLLYVTLSPPTRFWLRRPSFYLGGAVAFVVSLPVVLWNSAHDWPTLRLHLVEREHAAPSAVGRNAIGLLMQGAFTPGSSPFHSVVRVIVSQLFAYSPFLLPFLLIALVRLLRRARYDDRDLFLASFSWPVLAVILGALVRLQDAESHWAMVGFIPAAIAAGREGDEALGKGQRLPVLGTVGVVVSGILYAAAFVHTHTNALLRLIPPDHYDERADISNEMIGWDQVRSSVERAASRAGGDVVLASTHYAMCGRLAFETGDSPEVYCPTRRRSAFDFFGRRAPPPDATVILLTSAIDPTIPPALQRRKCSLVDELPIERAGREVARYFVHSCSVVPGATEVLSSSRSFRDEHRDR
jgi:hypothetical protein